MDWVALLLTVALLVCHGLFGALHVLAHGPQAPAHGADSPAQTASAAGWERGAAHSSGAGHRAGVSAAAPAPGGEGEPVADHAGGADYLAVMIALVGAAALGLVWMSVRALRASGIPAFRPRPRTAGGWLPRGPSPPVLQVFRL